jgi:predicted GNAT family acetyltransferase
MSQDPAAIEVRHQPEASRFATVVDGHEGFVEYGEGEGTLTITHTVVPAAIGGRGIAGRLVRAALEHARAAGLKVVPRCSYAADYLDKHPEYADLRA